MVNHKSFTASVCLDPLLCLRWSQLLRHKKEGCFLLASFCGSYFWYLRSSSEAQASFPSSSADLIEVGTSYFRHAPRNWLWYKSLEDRDDIKMKILYHTHRHVNNFGYSAWNAEPEKKRQAGIENSLVVGVKTSSGAVGRLHLGIRSCRVPNDSQNERDG